MDHYISMYIDDELSLDEKIVFLKHVVASEPYMNDAVSLLEQEKLLHSSLNRIAPELELKTERPSSAFFSARSLGWAAAACLIVLLSFLVSEDFRQPAQTQLALEPATRSHRFLINYHESSKVEITGSFTDWQRIPLSPTGTNGYWEVYLDLPPGEHRYSFIIDGSQYLPDPTVSAREVDDFGSTNSILKTEA